MKKTITWVLLAAMLLSAVALAIPVGAAATLYIQEVEAQLFTTPPTIDGYISEAEWGESSFIVESGSAASKSSSEPVNNAFFYWRPGYGTDDKNMSYEVWMRWDANYFYVGVKVTDPDGHSLKGGKGNTWNGDAMQIFVDYLGANSLVGGKTYVPKMGPTPWKYKDQVPDFLVGYPQIVGGFIEMFENKTKTGMTAYNNPAKGAAKVAVAPSGLNYSPDTASGISTYEIAIPWNYIFYNETGVVTLDTQATAADSAWGGINRELGVSMAVFNGEPGTSGYTHYLTWGSGICGSQYDEAQQTCGGSNRIILTDNPVTPESGYATYNPANLERFQRDYSGMDTGVYYDYLGGDVQRNNPLTSKDQLTTLTYDNDSDRDHWGCDSYQGLTKDSGDPEHGMVLDYTDPNVIQTYIDTALDADTQYKYPLSYTMEFDIRFQGTYAGTEDAGTDKYPPAVFNWFGGSTGYEYECGYYFNDGQFKIQGTESAGQPIATANFKMELDTWYNWRFVFDNGSCTARLYINDQPIFGEDVWNRYFYYSSDEHQNDGTLMLWRMFNTKFQMDNVRIYNAEGPKPQDVPPTDPTNPGGGNNNNSNTASGSEDLDTSNVYKDDNGYFRLPVYVTNFYKQATALSFDVTMNPDVATLDSISGLNEGTYTVEDKGDGKYLITITDFAQVRSMDVGAVFFEIVIKPASDDVQAADLGLQLKSNYKYTVATGDAMIYIGLAALVMAIGCAVVYKKRKSFVR
ncbi:MAG: hypothetical protein HFE66_00850 [Clostridiales bacterium]|jgi:hypothetical protein|nr:hypothetical protein [Clostridiales bacterium]